MHLTALRSSCPTIAGAAAVFLLPLVVTRASAQDPAAERLAALQPSTRPPAPSLQLPAVPRLQLAWPAPSSVGLREQGLGLYSLSAAAVPGEWRYASDGELRLQIPTAQLVLGSFSLSSQLETVPGRERGCSPDCRAPEWSPVLQLKYQAGDVGPLRQAGPQLRLEGARATGSGQGARRFFGAGFSGKF